MLRFFQRKTRPRYTRLFFATDIHGSQTGFRKFINAGKFYEVDALILGGDIIGKIAVPIIRMGGQRYRARLQGHDTQVADEQELADLRRRIGTMGFYDVIVDEDEYRALQADPAAVERLFQRLARERLLEWVALAEERLAGTHIRCYVSGGNDDFPDVLAALEDTGAQHVIPCEGRVVALDEAHTMISNGWSGPTPWRTPRECDEQELARLIDAAVRGVHDLQRCVFNFHDPPVDSTLDTCPKLDWDTDPPSQISVAGQVVLIAAGSSAVRAAIEQHQPVLGLHGHIHESRGVVKLGRTTCINPGSEYGEGVLRGCIINLHAGEVVSYQMTSG
jgi:uncharacterized protein